MDFKTGVSKSTSFKEQPEMAASGKRHKSQVKWKKMYLSQNV